MKNKEIRDLIEFIAETKLSEVNIETEEIKLSVKRNTSTQQVTTSQVITPSLPSQAETSTPTPSDNKYIEIKSPMIGTFYQSANPESAPFINIGDPVSVGQTVCIIEAMKLFNEIEAETGGTIVKILVGNATPVEYDQPLFLVDPS